MVNYLAILVVTLIAYVFGMVWYSPSLFGNQWMKLSGINKAQAKKSKKKGMLGKSLVSLVASFVTAWILSVLVTLFEATTFLNGLVVGLCVWLGFIATTTLSSVLWEGKPFNLWVLNNSHSLISIALMAGILAVW